MQRKLTVALDEETWKKFVESNPKPIDWLVEQIKNHNQQVEQKIQKRGGERDAGEC